MPLSLQEQRCPQHNPSSRQPSRAAHLTNIAAARSGGSWPLCPAPRGCSMRAQVGPAAAPCLAQLQPAQWRCGKAPPRCAPQRRAEAAHCGFQGRARTLRWLLGHLKGCGMLHSGARAGMQYDASNCEDLAGCTRQGLGYCLWELHCWHLCRQVRAGVVVRCARCCARSASGSTTASRLLLTSPAAHSYHL